jgi:hypothetical protein
MDTGRNKQISHPESQPVGRVVIDNRGRNVWQWSDSQLDSTTIMLKRLENSELALEPTRRLRRPDREGPRPAAARKSAGRDTSTGATGLDLQIEQTFRLRPGGGFDPYNRS